MPKRHWEAFAGAATYFVGAIFFFIGVLGGFGETNSADEIQPWFEWAVIIIPNFLGGLFFFIGGWFYVLEEQRYLGRVCVRE